ncbi:MAG: GNAT family N-acetyltransferase [Bacillota bacterium]
MEIRLATAADETAVCRLWKILLDFYRKEASPEMLKRSFQYCMGHPQRVLIFIILIEGVVTGTASLHMGHFSTWSGQFYGHVEDVVVDPAYRCRGLADLLIRHVIEVAREHNLCRLELTALNVNKEARNLYEKHGFTTDSVAYELHLK